MDELMERWKTKWREMEETITTLGKIRSELDEIGREASRTLYNPERAFQTHGLDVDVRHRIQMALEQALGERETLPTLSEQAEKDAGRVLRKEVAE